MFNSLLKISISVANQAVSSLGNFLFAFFLLRELNLADFGSFNIAFAISLAFGSLVQGYFLIQMIVLLPSIPPVEHKSFAARVLWLIVMVSIGVVFGGFVAEQFLGGMFSARHYVLATSMLASAFAVKEFYVRYSFWQGAPGLALTMHMGLVATLLAAVIIIPSDWTASTAVFVYTAAHIVAIVVGASQIRLPLMTCLNVEIWSTLSQLNLGGRWAALSSCLYSLRGNAHTLIVAVAIGPGAVAAVNAARLFVTPATLLIPAISNHALPQLARTAAQSEREVFTKVWLQTVAGLLFIAIAYGFVLIAVWPIASQRFLPEEYLGAGPLVILWWLYACMLCIRSGLEWGNQALGAFAKMSQVNIVGALVALAAVSVLTSTLGPIGSIVGLIIAEIVVIFGFIGLLKR